MKRPILYLLAFLVSGIVLGSYGDIGIALFFMLGLSFLCFCLYKLYRYKPVFIWGKDMKVLAYSLCTVFQPSSTFYYIKHNREQIRVWPALFIIFMLLPVRVAGIFTEHFPLAYNLPEDTAILIEAFIILAPVLTWPVACFITSSILDGETTFVENLTATAYSMIPYIILTVPLSLFSNVLSLDEQVIYIFFLGLKWAWVVLLLLAYVKTMNTYSVSKTIFVALFTLVFIILIWAVLFLLYMLTNQLFTFINTVIIEARMLFG